MANKADNTDILPGEVWKDIAGWDGYQVSNMGRVRSLDRVRVQRMRDGSMQPVLYPGRVRSQSACPKTRYFKVGMSNYCGGFRRTMAVHRMVCEAFHGPGPKDYEVAHNNGDRQDNRAENLRWATRKENLADMHRHGTALVGDRRWNTRVSDAALADIRRRVANGDKVADLAHEHGVLPSSLYQRLNGRKRRRV